MARAKILKRQEPKPCPRCYAPMRPTVHGFECERHGAPPAPVPTPRITRSPKVKVRKERAARKPRGPKVWTRSAVRYPSDLKEYPLPPSPDGRDNARTSAASPTTARSALTPELLAEATEKAKGGLTPWQIAETMWERAGYSSRESCKGSLYRALRKARVLA